MSLSFKRGRLPRFFFWPGYLGKEIEEEKLEHRFRSIKIKCCRELAVCTGTALPGVSGSPTVPQCLGLDGARGGVCAEPHCLEHMASVVMGL